MSEGFVLLLNEVRYHPDSYLKKLCERVETTSVVNIRGKDELRKYQRPPLFDEKYLVIFDDVKLFQENKMFLSFSTMMPVIHAETRTQLEDARFICREAKLPYKIYVNEFDKDLAVKLIQENASVPVSDEVIKAILRQVGLSPLRILTAVGVCEQMGYTKQVVDKYIDKWVYPDLRSLIECLLGVPKSKAAVNSCRKYLHLNRHWYRFVQQNLVDELDAILNIYKDKLAGRLASDSVYAYLDSERVTRARLMYALGLYEKVSITSVIALREYIKNASLMEVVLRLG